MESSWTSDVCHTVSRSSGAVKDKEGRCLIYLLSSMRHISFSTRRNRKVEALNSLQSSLKGMVILLTVNQTVSLNLTLISVSPLRLYLASRAIYF